MFRNIQCQPIKSADIESGRRDNPFAAREGKCLTWSKVQMKV